VPLGFQPLRELHGALMLRIVCVEQVTMTFASRTISAIVKFGGVRYCVSGLAANHANGVANRMPRGEDAYSASDQDHHSAAGETNDLARS